MKEEIRKEILYDLEKAVGIFEVRELKDNGELKELSDHAIEDIALYKDLELVSITVLLYSLYKIASSFKEQEYQSVLRELRNAVKSLQQRQLGGYNQSIRALYQMVRHSDAKVKEHLEDVMQAARIRKGTSLLQRGLSIGQAAGLMGLSNWDLQQYAGKTTVLEQHTEKIPASQRVKIAFTLFGVS